MRLLTHNMLINPRKGFEGAFPLKLIPTKVSREETKFDSALVINLLNKIDYKALLYAAGTVGVKIFPQSSQSRFLQTRTTACCARFTPCCSTFTSRRAPLVCPRSNREFPIKQAFQTCDSTRTRSSCYCSVEYSGSLRVCVNKKHCREES